MKVEVCPRCGKTPKVKATVKMISCACGMPWLPIDLWNEMSKALIHYRNCKHIDEIKTKEEPKW